MVDTVQLGAPCPTYGHHGKRETAGLGQDFEDQLVSYNFNINNIDAFDDVNAEDSEFNQYIQDAAHQAPLSSPPVLSSSTGPSPTTSYIGYPIVGLPVSPITPPGNNGGLYDSDTRRLGSTNVDTYDLDDFIEPGAYQPVSIAFSAETSSARPSLTLPRHLAEGTRNDGFSADVPPDNHPTTRKSGPLMPPPAIPQRQRLPSVTYSPPPDTGLSLSSNGSYFPIDEKHPGALDRSFSKRGRTDTSGTIGLVKKNSKRLKQKENGYPCEECHETFDRACDKTKHFQRTHAPKDSLPHSCPECEHEGKVKRFLYPKDVRRHLKQVHKIITKEIVSIISPSTSPTSGKPTKTFGLLAKTVVGLMKLRISAASPNHSEKFIMVTSDQSASPRFVDVEVTGIKTATALTKRVMSTLKMNSAGVPFTLQAQTYTRRRNGGQLGPKLDAQSMLDLVLKNASPQGSDRFLISMSFDR